MKNPAQILVGVFGDDMLPETIQAMRKIGELIEEKIDREKIEKSSRYLSSITAEDKDATP